MTNKNEDTQPTVAAVKLEISDFLNKLFAANSVTIEVDEGHVTMTLADWDIGQCSGHDLVEAYYKAIESTKS